MFGNLVSDAKDFSSALINKYKNHSRLTSMSQEPLHKASQSFYKCYSSKKLPGHLTPDTRSATTDMRKWPKRF